MHTYLVLLRGVNVGGKNKVPMATLRACLTEAGFSNVTTFIASGNVIVQSSKTAKDVKKEIETLLPTCFSLDTSLIKVLVLTRQQLQHIIDARPKGFGEQPEHYHSDAIFLIDIPVIDALRVFDPREGVDAIWPGDGVIYSQRVSELRTKSRLSKIIGTPAYASMTVRSWNTTITLLRLLIETEKKL
ncbi:MAG TPA: DUF1697 domain-containing protein [Candidatus Saccharimonadales bacterium]|nr:DUF1697 domain-containing protein [Candidatus Saccharimonadales bacterium]